MIEQAVTEELPLLCSTHLQKDFVGDDGWTRLPLDRPAVLEYPVASRSGTFWALPDFTAWVLADTDGRDASREVYIGADFVQPRRFRAQNVHTEAAKHWVEVRTDAKKSVRVLILVLLNTQENACNSRGIDSVSPP